MTRMLLFCAGCICPVWLAGCTSGPLGPRTTYSYSPVPSARTGQPVSRPPIATQPVLTPTGTVSSVSVVPFAALPRHALIQVPQGIPPDSRVTFQSGSKPLAMLASNDRPTGGNGTVPVQLPYSNAVYGFEGSFADPHGISLTPAAQAPNSNPPPVSNDPELARVINQWNQLEDSVKKSIVRLATSQ